MFNLNLRPGHPNTADVTLAEGGVMGFQVQLFAGHTSAADAVLRSGIFYAVADAPVAPPGNTAFIVSGIQTGQTGTAALKEVFKATASGSQTGQTGASTLSERFKLSVSGTQTGQTGAASIVQFNDTTMTASGTQTGQTGSATLTISGTAPAHLPVVGGGRRRRRALWQLPETRQAFEFSARGLQGGQSGRSYALEVNRIGCNGRQASQSGSTLMNNDDIEALLELFHAN